jgi:hypothetical protein
VRENVYLFMGIAGYILVFIVVAMAIIDWCCYNILSGTFAFLLTIVMVLSAVVLIRVAAKKL